MNTLHFRTSITELMERGATDELVHDFALTYGLEVKDTDALSGAWLRFFSHSERSGAGLSSNSDHGRGGYGDEDDGFCMGLGNGYGHGSHTNYGSLADTGNDYGCGHVCRSFVDEGDGYGFGQGDAYGFEDGIEDDEDL